MNNTQCNSTEVFDINHDFYGERCSMDRSSWEYTKPRTFSMVTEVRKIMKPENQDSSYISMSIFIRFNRIKIIERSLPVSSSFPNSKLINKAKRLSESSRRSFKVSANILNKS